MLKIRNFFQKMITEKSILDEELKMDLEDGDEDKNLDKEEEGDGDDEGITMEEDEEDEEEIEEIEEIEEEEI